MTIRLEKEHLEPDVQTAKVLKFLEANAMDISIIWKMHITPTEKSEIKPLKGKALVCYNKIDQTKEGEKK